MEIEIDADTKKQSQNFIVIDIIKFMLTTIKKNFIGIILIFVFYGGAGAAVQLIFGQSDVLFDAGMRSLLSFGIVMSLVSVLRPAFECGKLKISGIFPSFGFIKKVILSFLLFFIAVIVIGLLFSIFSIFLGYFLRVIFGRVITPRSIYYFMGFVVFLNLLFSVFCSFCLIAFSGKSGFWESLGNAFKIFTENKFVTFCIFAILSAVITMLFASYMAPIFSYFGSPSPANMAKVVALQEFFTARIAVVFAVLIPLYLIVLSAIYFTLAHEGDTRKIIESQMHYSGYYSQYVGLEDDGEAEKAHEDGVEGFSLSNAFYFSWGIYKKLITKLTAGVAVVYAVFLSVCLAAIFILQQTFVIPPVFSGNIPSIKYIFILCACFLVFYYFLMFFYSSYLHGFFRGKGMRFKNFFPPFKIILRFIFFLCFITVFILVLPFIIEKIDLLLQIAIKSFTFPFSAVVGACSVLFAVIIIFAMVSFFYVPLFILDGHSFSDALTTCSEMMKGQRMVFFCVLIGLFLINLIGHALIAGWLFTVPFTVLVLIQIYTTISSGYSKYQEDIVNYE